MTKCPAGKCECTKYNSNVNSCEANEIPQHIEDWKHCAYEPVPPEKHPSQVEIELVVRKLVQIAPIGFRSEFGAKLLKILLEDWPEKKQSGSLFAFKQGIHNTVHYQDGKLAVKICEIAEDFWPEPEKTQKIVFVEKISTEQAKKMVAHLPISFKFPTDLPDEYREIPNLIGMTQDGVVLVEHVGRGAAKNFFEALKNDLVPYLIELEIDADDRIKIWSLIHDVWDRSGRE